MIGGDEKWLLLIQVIIFTSCSAPSTPGTGDPSEHLVAEIYRDRIETYNNNYRFNTFDTNGYAKDKKEDEISDIQYTSNILYSYLYDTTRQHFFPSDNTETSKFNINGYYHIVNSENQYKDIGISHFFDPLEANRNHNAHIKLYAVFNEGVPFPSNPETDKVFLYMRQSGLDVYELVYEIHMPFEDSDDDDDI